MTLSSSAPDSVAPSPRTTWWPARGLKVLLLERGMPYPPGSFARTPREMRRNFWDPGAGLHGLL